MPRPCVSGTSPFAAGSTIRRGQRFAANAILALRASDGAGVPAAGAYSAPDAGTPGVYFPIGTQVALLPCWGSVDTWAMRSGSQFRPEGTPAHPDYTSGHTSVSSAIATIIALELGDEPGTPLVSTVPTPIGPITRQWNTFSEGVDEVIDARVYSGIHFRTSDEVGARTGRQAARFALTHALQPCGRGKGKCK